MKVLSLFDGMGCGRIALRELGIECEYYASEIDRRAIEQTAANFPDAVHLGDVRFLRRAMTLPADTAARAAASALVSPETKARLAAVRSVDWGGIDLVLAGSPCQGFSFAGKMLAFDDPRSALFFEFVKILEHIKSLNPGVLFMLENVNMKQDHLRVISAALGVAPVNINSSLVSAQNRNRWYWTNIADVPPPADRGIVFADILDEEVHERYFVSPAIEALVLDSFRQKKKYVQVGGTKSLPLLASMANGGNGNHVCVKLSRHGALTAADNRSAAIAQRRRGSGLGTWGLHGHKAPTLTGSGWERNNHVVRTANYLQLPGKFEADKRFFYEDGKHAACVVRSDKTGVVLGSRIRRLTPTECARLQTIPDWYRWVVPDTQIYKLLGNGWTVEVIKHILSFLPEKVINKLSTSYEQ